MKKGLYYGLFSLIALILQVQLKLYLPFMEHTPDFLLIVVVLIAFSSGTKAGFFSGLILGLIQDVFLGGFFGVYTVSKAILGLIAGLVEGKVYKQNILIPPLVVFFISILQEILIIPLIENLIFSINLWTLFKSYVIKFALYNTVLTFIVYSIIYYFNLNGKNRRSYYG
mgnify:FL=1